MDNPGNITIGGSTIESPLRDDITSISSLINAILPFVFSIAGILLFVLIVMGGFKILTSDGNPDQFSEGKKTITAAIIGFILLMLAFFVTRLIAFIFNLDPSGLITG